jgi:16S rRNA G966 N2-methylase RsmD
VTRGTAVGALPGFKADIVFLDPPYTDPEEYGLSMAVVKAPLVIAQHATRESLADSYGKLVRYRMVKQGENTLSFYRVE